MRVCLVSAAYRPYLSGVGEHVHDLALALRDLGHSVHILTSRFPSLEPGSPGPESSGPPVTRLGRGLVVPALGGHFTLPVGLDLSRRVRDFLHRHDFDVVHCHGIFPPETAYWAALHARCPVVVTFHTLAFRPPRFFRAGFRALFPAVGRRLRARIAVSQACADWARTFFPGECRVIPNGVDSGRFGPSVEPAAVLTGCPSLLYVSRVDKRKGLAVLLRALPEVLRRVPGARLFVVGSGPDEPRCRLLCRTLGIERAVEFCGFVQPDDLPAWYAGCTAFCAPALGPESMGVILLEGLAAGRPVVASDITGYDEVIRHDVDGLLFRAGDQAALASALAGVLSSAALRDRLSAAALERAAEFAWPRIGARVEQVYREVV